MYCTEKRGASLLKKNQPKKVGEEGVGPRVPVERIHRNAVVKSCNLNKLADF